MGGDHRTSDTGAHVCQPDHGRVCVGPSTWCQNVSTRFAGWEHAFISCWGYTVFYCTVVVL